MEWISRFLRILIIVGLVSSPTLGQETKYRTFTNKEGKKIEASVVAVKGADVIIVMKNGKRFKFPIVSLSEADQEYVKSWKKPIGKLEFEVKCTKKPAAQAKSDNTLPTLSGRTRSKGYCYEVTVTNKGFDAIPELEVRYVLYKGTSGNTRTGTSVQQAGQGKFKLPAVERLKSVTGLTDAVTVTQSTSSSATLQGDGTYDKSYTKTRESLAGVKLELYAGETLVKEYTHGRIGK